MTDRPILFSGPMVQAILQGRKTQTRRVLNRLAQFGPISEFGVSDTPGYHWHFRDRRMLWHDLLEWEMKTRLPFAPGGRLWVRETFTLTQHGTAVYRADGKDETGRRWATIAAGDPDGEVLWKPSIFMPKAKSRLTLTITDVRVQRVQEISEDDAFSEGAVRWGAHGPSGGVHETATDNFRRLWDGLNAKRGFGWEANPWVVAVTFETHRCNIDQMEAQG